MLIFLIRIFMPYLIKSTSKESSKRRYKCDSPVPACCTNCYSYNILLGNKAFNKSSWINRFDFLRICRILRVSV